MQCQRLLLTFTLGLTLALPLGAGPALAGPRSAPAKPVLTEVEQQCQYYGQWIEAIANTRDDGTSYLKALAIVRRRQDYRAVSSQAKARMERDVQDVYTLLHVSGIELRNLMERSCVQARMPATGPSTPTPTNQRY